MDVINVINLFSAVQTAQKTVNQTGISQTIKLKDYAEKAEKTEKNTITATKEKTEKAAIKE